MSEANETIHHLTISLDLNFTTEAEFAYIETQVATIRHKVINLILRIRPAKKRRRSGSPAPKTPAPFRA